jgi:DNA (cytosine-5)-methyltransferase 1
VLEFFAGVGGFRGGLEGFPGLDEAGSGQRQFQVVWSNQFEPSTKRQHASEVYAARWGSEGHLNEDINHVLASSEKFSQLLATNADVLVGGFPCQDYSVAKSASAAAGIEGKKGVLWWSIHETLRRHLEAGQPIKHVILENVDRLLKSPTACRGRDFAIILASLGQLGYAVEWQVVNAADYGFPQRRRRVFIVAHHYSTGAYRTIADANVGSSTFLLSDHIPWDFAESVLKAALPWETKSALTAFSLPADPLEAQGSYTSLANGDTRFLTSGVYINGEVATLETSARVPDAANGQGAFPVRTLGDVVKATGEKSIPAEYFISPEEISKWSFLKGGKSLKRTSRTGHEYIYSEGAMSFPDPLDRPARTIITAEGGSAASRFKHVVQANDGRLRRLLPEELETLNGFPRGFTALDGVSDTKRAFFMGNALVTGIVKRIGDALAAAVH